VKSSIFLHSNSFALSLIGVMLVDLIGNRHHALLRSRRAKLNELT
jgi:hypothetical protein